MIGRAAGLLVGAAIAASAAAQSVPIVQPGAPGAPARILTPEQAANIQRGLNRLNGQYSELQLTLKPEFEDVLVRLNLVRLRRVKVIGFERPSGPFQLRLRTSTAKGLCR